MVEFRKLNKIEIIEAYRVFGSSLNYDNILVTNLMPGGAMTLAVQLDYELNNWVYAICWNDTVLQQNFIYADEKNTFIHEMTHVWQGQHGIVPQAYMVESIAAQLTHALKDASIKGKWVSWNEHRSSTYLFNWSDIGKNWNEFNVEQQASIVESWYMSEEYRIKKGRFFGDNVAGGGESEDDPRFPYIHGVIRRGNRNAHYPLLKSQFFNKTENQFDTRGRGINHIHYPATKTQNHFQPNPSIKQDGKQKTPLNDKEIKTKTPFQKYKK